jgi:hypothetical protein
MAFLFLGGEVDDFTCGSPAISTSSVNFRSGYARLGLSSSASTATYQAVFSAASAAFWLSFRVYTTGFTSASGGSGIADFVQLKPGSGSSLLAFSTTASSSNTVGLRTYNGSSYTNLVTATGTFINSSNNKVDIYCSCGGSGTLTVYINGAQVLTYSGDLTVGSTIADIASAVLCAGQLVASAYLSEVIVSDSDTRTLSLTTLAPSASGSNSAWTGAFTDVNDTSATLSTVDASYLSTSTNDAVHSLACNDLPTTNLTVHAVQVKARAMKDVTGPTNLQVGIFNSSGGYSSDIALGTGFADAKEIFTTNPIDSSAWTPAAVNAAQLAVKARA